MWPATLGPEGGIFSLAHDHGSGSASHKVDGVAECIKPLETHKRFHTKSQLRFKEVIRNVQECDGQCGSLEGKEAEFGFHSKVRLSLPRVRAGWQLTHFRPVSFG